MKKVLTSFAQLNEVKDNLIITKIQAWLDGGFRTVKESFLTEEEVNDAIRYVVSIKHIHSLEYLMKEYEETYTKGFHLARFNYWTDKPVYSRNTNRLRFIVEISNALKPKCSNSTSYQEDDLEDKEIGDDNRDEVFSSNSSEDYNEIPF